MSNTLLSKPPSTSERQKCWNARNDYWTCLDENNLWLHGLRPRKPLKNTKDSNDLQVCVLF